MQALVSPSSGCLALLVLKKKTIIRDVQFFRTAHLYPDMWFLRFWVVKPPPIVHARDPPPSLLCLYHRSIANPLGSEGSLLDTPM